MADYKLRRKKEGLIEFMRRKRMLQQRFREKCGYEGNFFWPRTYQEKVQYRKLWGNNAFYAMVADKYRVREYVAEKAGERYLIPLLGVYDRLSDDVFDNLPERFVIKANHGCTWNKVVWNKQELDIQATVSYFNEVVQQVYGQAGGEFHYSLIEPKILIEELLVDAGEIPYNYDIFSYNSDAGFDYAITLQRSGTPPGTSSGLVHFDKHWNILEGELGEEERQKYVNPKNFDEMVQVAKALSSDFDFARVDLYNVNGAIYFGEITLTPAAGFGPIANEYRARLRSEMWKLDMDNKLLYRKPWARRFRMSIRKINALFTTRQRTIQR